MVVQYRNFDLKKFEIYRYVVEFAKLFYWKFFLQPIFLMYAITMSLFLYLTVCVQIEQPQMNNIQFNLFSFTSIIG